MKKRIAAGIAALLMTFAAAPAPEIAEFLPLAAPITAQAATYTVYSNDKLLTATLDTAKSTITLKPLSSYYSGKTSSTSFSFDFSGYKTELFNSLKAKDSSVDLSKCKVILEPPSQTYFSTSMQNLESVTFNDGFINEVGAYMFFKCPKLKYATFGSSVTSIGLDAFANCSAFLGSSSGALQLNSITEIGDGAFASCAFKSISFNSSTKTIGKIAFAGCNSLTSVTFPASLTSIEMQAFMSCNALTSVKFADNTNLSLIGQQAFWNDKVLKTIDFGKGTKVKSINTGAFQEDTALTQMIVDGNTSNNSLPNGLNYLGVKAFYGDTSLKNMTIPSTLKRLPNNAFTGCTALTSVWFGNEQGTSSTCDTIGTAAFSNCSALTSVILPASCTTIASNAFQNCTSLEKLVVSDKLKYIDGNTVFTDTSETFAHNRIEDSSTSDAYDYSSGNTFAGCTKLAIYPRADMTKAESSWSSYKNKINLPSTVEVIPSGCFQGDTGITAVTVGNIKAVSGTAFKGCSALQTLSPIGAAVEAETLCFPASCTNIQASAFYNDLKFKYIKIVGKGTAALDSNGTNKYSGNLVNLLTFGTLTPISNCTVTLSGTSFEYTGSAIQPTVTVKNGSTTLVNGTNYSVSYSNNTNIGTATVTITGKGMYSGSTSKTFTITAKKISGCTMTLSASSFTYTGSAIQPTVTIKNGSTTLVNGTDYTLSYSNNTAVGTATVTATGKGKYTGTLSKTFTITANSISSCTVTLSGTSFEYTGSAIQPTVTVKNGSTTLVNGTDYSVSYSNNTNIGTATVTITGKGKYTGSASKSFTITAKKLSNCSMTLSGTSFTYTGSAIQPTVTIKNGSTTLVNGTDYTLSYSNNTAVGTATVTATGKGKYTGTLSKTFTISAKNATNINGCTITLSGTSFEYTGSAIQPTVTIKNGSTTLVNGTDYTLSYSNNTNVGTATVTATGKGNYTGTISKTFTITAKKISGCTMTLSGTNFTYTGSAIQPTVTIKNGSTTLVNGTDYTLSYSNNTNVGTATVTATGKGKYTGTLSKTFTISAKNATNINGCTMTLSGTSFEYTGSAIQPAVTVKNGSTTLVNGTDYTLSYSNNTNVGTATVTATGKGNYSGTISKTFTITAKKISDCTMTLSATSFDYTGSAIKPTVTIKSGSTTLVNGTDYSLSYSNNTNVGTATVTATGKGKYTGTISRTFTIGMKNIDTCTITLSATSFTYTGSAIQPAVTVKNGSTTLTNGTDYTLSYSNNTNAGTATVTISGKGKYGGSLAKTFTISPKSISSCTMTLSGTTFNYTGSAIQPTVTVKSGSTTLVNGTDYTLTYSNNTNIGTASVTATGKGNYSGTVSKTFTINANNINICTMTLSQTSLEYTGSAIQPAVSIKNGSATLVKGTDYTVAYSNNTNVGTATVTATGIGKYSGTISKTFTITPKDISSCTMTLSAYAFDYTGSAIKPDVIVKNGSTTLVNGTDYTISYSGNTSVGTAKVTVSGKGKYKGTLTSEFTIGLKNLGSCTMKLSGTMFDYTGSAIKPEVIVKNGSTVLTNGTDYTLTYENNVEIGIATVTATGKGTYGGTLTARFRIGTIALENCDMTLSADAFEYTGSPLKPTVTITSESKTLVNGTDFTLAYSNNTDVGTATVTVTGIGKYSGTVTLDYYIATKSISGMKMKLSTYSADYTGLPIEPEVTIKSGSKTLVEGTDYTLGYINNIGAGTATVIATGIGNYVDTLSMDFTITGGPADEPGQPGEPSEPTEPGEPSTFMLGDVNGDGKINVTDIAKIAAHVKGIKQMPEEYLAAADINGDGKINVTDIAKIAAHVKGIKIIK
ncbi:MAG: leucine-rich repeat protein [Ruminococcus sp.]|uniref:leucine-rich repeat protein n=1 Tax=Ruminococcus sp. TaxID=41978 RepID=UPI0025DE6C9B|nr:leucine-rich repeat protein [Ruminococcus sp.]MBR0529996.1 leucine-rich repeat protein [Ruminococcus sp.]